MGAVNSTRLSPKPSTILPADTRAVLEECVHQLPDYRSGREITLALTITNESLERTISGLRKEASQIAKRIVQRTVGHGWPLGKGRSKAQILGEANDLAFAIAIIQVGEIAAQKRSLRLSQWKERPYFVEMLESLDITESRGMELRTGISFEQLIGEADVVRARALGVRLD